MEFSLRAAEITTLLENRMTNFSTHSQVDEIGQVVSAVNSLLRTFLRIDFCQKLLFERNVVKYDVY
ncbi:ATP synthase subunit alpha, mitochondrial [Dendrobium catenatum]|uniref:ATP synthase subunit alpha, mitochondrial n=1 Tax=Dendrobium catenatum TaxID=906689 RepID=A0A2I0VAY0_9ASPA|nr:ATP synthase subunit alpha, mitochondrial [Dendrobium catenatum]